MLETVDADKEQHRATDLNHRRSFYPRGWPKRGYQEGGAKGFLARHADSDLQLASNVLVRLAGGRPSSYLDVRNVVRRAEQMARLVERLDLAWPPKDIDARVVDLAALSRGFKLPANDFLELVEQLSDPQDRLFSLSQLTGATSAETPSSVVKGILETRLETQWRASLAMALLAETAAGLPQPGEIDWSIRLSADQLRSAPSAADLSRLLDAHPRCPSVARPLRLDDAVTAVRLLARGESAAATAAVLPGPDAKVKVSALASQLEFSEEVTRHLLHIGSSVTTVSHLDADHLVEASSGPKFAAKLRAAEKAIATANVRKERAEREREARAKEQRERVEAERAQRNAVRARLGLEESGYADVRSDEAARALGISLDALRELVRSGKIAGEKVSARGGRSYWRVPLDVVAGIADFPPTWLKDLQARRREKQRREAERTEQVLERLERSSEVLLRAVPPARVGVYLGPTNSGKTHRALEHLAEHGAGVYAAPLRMLAWEARDKLAARLGDDAVGLITGEERLNADAPVLCCTAEMAPRRAPLLVLDEVQWAADPERGWAWTRLLAGADVDELYVTGEVGAAPLVRAVLGEEVPITWCDRLVPLAVSPPVSLRKVPERSVVIAFSRNAVLHLAGRLQDAGRSVSILYGALPPEVRRLQIAEFLEGRSELVVATDVVGHGINLPVETVVFSETNKFDGEKRRPLLPWEIAQIGGRAGRFGLADHGSVSSLSNEAGFNPDHGLVAKTFNESHVEIDGRPAYRRVSQAFVGPALEDLGAKRAIELRAALAAWSAAAAKAFAGRPWAQVQDAQPLIARLAVLGQNRLRHLELEDAWALSRSPLDPDDRGDVRLLTMLGARLAGEPVALARLLPHPPSARFGAAALESAARSLVGLRWATLRFGVRLDVTHDQVSALLDQVSVALNAALQRAASEGVAHCHSCGKLCAPWFRYCDRCHERFWSPWDDE